MFCNRCGSKVADDAGFCPNCGMVLKSAGQALPPAGPPGSLNHVHPRQEGKALAGLILGILALFFSIVTGIPAIILGHLSLAEIKKSAGQLAGEGMAMAGLILGYISVALVPFLLIIAIPNLQHSKKTPNQAAAAATVRSLIFAQSAYSSNYPKAGYAPDLATLGPGGPACASGEGVQKNACLVDGELGCTAGTSGNWCEKDQYKYSILGIGKGGVPEDYVITAVPVDSSAGETSYCATSDGIVRSRPGMPPAQAIKTVAECRSWAPI